MEVSTIPKAVMENFLTTMAIPATFKEPAPIRRDNGYSSVPLFHGSTIPPSPCPASVKLPGTSLHPFRDDSYRTEPSFGFFTDPVLCGSPFGNPSPVKEKPKRVRKSRAGATTKKRTTAFENMEGPTTLQPDPPPRRRRPSAKSCAEAENAEKPPPRKRNRSKANPKDEQALCPSTKTSSKGVLGIYGLDTRTLDATQYVRDVSLESLMAGDYGAVPSDHKQGLPARCLNDQSFGSHISSILQKLAKPCNTEPPSQLREAAFSKPVESRPKFLLDLESTPMNDSQRGGTLNMEVQASCYAPPFLGVRETTEASAALMAVDTISVVPPAEFWNKLQIHPNISLDSLASQSSAMLENRGFPSETRPRAVAGDNNTGSLPLLPMFSFSSTQTSQDILSDRNMSLHLSYWLRAEPVKQEMFEEHHHLVLAPSDRGKHPSTLEVEVSPRTKPVEKSGKQGFWDIDLNKQSPEAEAAASISPSTSIDVFRPETGEGSFSVVQVRDIADYDLMGFKSEVKKKQPMVVSDASQPTCNTILVKNPKVVDDAPEECPSLPDDTQTAEAQTEALQSGSASEEPSAEAAANASTSLPALILPEVNEAQEMCSEVPCSPGVQAIARLLCKMANSSSPFYSEEKDEEEPQATTSYVNVSSERPAKAARIVGPMEKDVRTCKRPTFHETQPSVKAQTSDGKDRTLYNQVVGNMAEKISGSEPWAATPPRQAHKNVASRSQSSDSDKSSRCRTREHCCIGVVGKLERHQHSASKMTLSHMKDQSKGTHTRTSKTSFLPASPTRRLSVSFQQESSTCEMKPVAPARGVEGGLAKLSRPRSRMGKSCLASSMNRSTSRFSLQPRSLSGCSMKSPSTKQALPLGGEVRDRAK